MEIKLHRVFRHRRTGVHLRVVGVRIWHWGIRWHLLPQLLTARQTADVLHVHVNTVRSWEQTGRLLPIRVGSRRDRRYPVESVRRIYDDRRLRHPLHRTVHAVRTHPAHSAVVAIVVAVSTTIAGFAWNHHGAGAQSGAVVVFSPTSCSGWSNADAARSISVSRTATADQFTDGNAATVARGAAAQLVVPTFDCRWNGSAGSVDGRKKVSDAAVQVSLAADAPADGNGVVIVKLSTDGVTWNSLGTIVLRGSVNNASNGGFWTFGLPASIQTVDDLRAAQFRIDADFTGSVSYPSTIRLDGVGITAAVAASHISTARVAPSTCGGWSNASAAQTIDLKESDGAAAFVPQSSAVFARSASAGIGGVDATDSSITCRDFPVLRTTYGTTILNARLLVSAAATASLGSEDVLVFEYSVDGGQSWNSFDSAVVSGGISNQQHGGYWSVPLPVDIRRDQLALLQMRVRYAAGGPATDATVFVDGMSLELTTQKATGSDMGSFSFLTKHYFLPIEDPTIFIDQDSVSRVQIFDAAGNQITVPTSTDRTDVGGATRIALAFTNARSLRPGTYTVQMDIRNGKKTVTEQQTFTWGVLSANTPKSSYLVGDFVPVTAGVVDENGVTVCNAAMTARITAPDGTTQTASTADGTIIRSATCGPKSVTANPDYLARFKAVQAGTYHVALSVAAASGTQSITLDVPVVAVQQLVVERVGPARINPTQPYLMHLFVTPDSDYHGTVIDTVPESFVVSEVSNAGTVVDVAHLPTSIMWTVDWKKGTEYELTYTFDAPDQSPALFSLGPVRVGTAAIGFPWTIASDQVIRLSDPSVTFTPVSFDSARWNPQRPSLVIGPSGVVPGNQQAVLDVAASGFMLGTSQTPSPLRHDVPLTVTSVTLKRPDGSVVLYPNATQIIQRDGRERWIEYIQPDATFAPGQYTVDADVTDGTHTAIVHTTFRWGTLDVTAQTALLRSGLEIPLHITSRDDAGMSSCDADLRMNINGPSDFHVALSTEASTITHDGSCSASAPAGNEFLASFMPTKPGTYTARVIRGTDDSSEHVAQQFVVVAAPPVSDATKSDVQNAVSESKHDYRASEKPSVSIETRRDAVFGAFGVDATTRSVKAVTLVDPSGHEHSMPLPTGSRSHGRSTYTDLNVDPEYLTTHGTYRVRVTIEQGGQLVTTEQDFSWGVLAINTDRSIELPNTDAKIGMAVLDDSGKTLCDAAVTLTVTNPSGKTQSFSTKKGSITKDPACVDKGVTNSPDYAAEYRTGGAGTYAMHLVADTQNGTRTIDDSFMVADHPQFDVQRTVFPTRIYPRADYPVSLTVVPSTDYQGTVIETVPDSFIITTVSDNGIVASTGQGTQTITWNVTWNAGETHPLGYTIDFPDVSPEYYVLGPLQINDFREARQWQIASDDISSAMATRALTLGFELNTTTAGVDYASNIGSPSISASTVRSGSYALRTNPSASTQGIVANFYSADDTSYSWYARAYVYIASAPSAQVKVMAIRSSLGDEVAIRMNTDRTLELWDETQSSKVGSSSSAVPLNTWTRLELSYSVGYESLSARVNGVEFAADWSQTRTFANGASMLVVGALGPNNVTSDLYWDDLAVNNDNGTGLDNWPGDGKIVYIRPNGTGTNTAWTGAYTTVNEVTPDDASSYMNCTANSQQEDLTLQNASDVGIGAGDYISLTAMHIRIGGGSTASSRNVIERLYLGSNFDSSTRSYSSTSWVTDTTSSWKQGFVSYDLPGATGLTRWTTSDLDNAYINLNTSDCSPQMNVTNVWVAVEYIPAPGGRIFTSGFELQSTAAGMEWSVKDGSPSISTSTYRSGAAALQISSLSSGTRQALDYQFKAANSNGPFYLRTYLYISSPPSAENRILDIRDSSNNARVYVTLDNAKALRLYDEDGQIGSASGTLALTGWYRLEVKIDGTGSGATDTVEATLDGVSFASSSTRDLSTGVTQIGVGGNLNSETQTTGAWYFDDVAVNENIGSVQNGYPGAGRVVDLRPNAVGDSDSWSLNPATCNAASNPWQCIDEVTPNDSTDYLSDVYGTGGGNPPFLYHVTSSSSAGIASTDPITVVQAGVRMQSTSATTSTDRLVLFSGTLPSYSLTWSDKIITTSTTWFTNSATQPQLYPLTAYAMPQTNNAITASGLDSLELGVAYVNNSAEQDVTAAWMVVEYNPPEIGVSGTVYSNASNETTAFDCNATSVTLHVAVNGGTNSTGTCTGSDGLYKMTVPAPAATNDPVAVFIDSGASQKATSVTLAADTTSSIALNLIQDRVLVTQDSATAMTNAKLGTADNGDAGIRYAVSGGNLTVESGMELHVMAGKTFAPGGTVTTHAASAYASADGDVHIPATATLTMGSNALSVGGDLTNAGTFSYSGTQTTTFTATGTGFTYTPGTGNLDAMTFNGAGGEWIMAGATSIDGDLTVTTGTLTGPSSATFAVAGNVSFSGSYVHNSGTLAMSGTSKTLTSGGQTLNNFQQSGGSTTMSGATTIANNLTISSGTLTAPSATTLSIGGNMINNGTFTANSGTVVITGSGTSTIAGSSATTFNNFTSTAAGKTIKFKAQSGGVPVFTFSGTFTITGNSGSHITLQSDTNGTQWYAHFAGTQSGTVTYATITDTGGDGTSSVVTLDATSTNGGNVNTTVWYWPPTGVTISGILYDPDYNPIDCSSTNVTVRVKVNGAGSYADNCANGDGIYSIATVPVAVGNTVTIFIDDTNIRAAFVTRAADSTTNITADLYQDTLVLSHNDAGPLTNSDLEKYSGTDNSNIEYSVSGGALTVTSGVGISVDNGKTFQPGGSISGSGSYVSLGLGSTLTVGGTSNAFGGFYLNDNSSLTIGANTSTLGIGGGANVTVATTGTPTVTSSNAINVFSGSVSLYDLSINASVINTNGTISAHSISFTSGNDSLSATGTITLSGSLSVATSTVLTIGTSTSVTGDITTAGTGSITYTGTPTVTTSGTAIGGGSGDLIFYNLTKSGASTSTWTGSGVNTVRNALTLSGGTLTAPSGQLILNSIVQSGGTFAHNNGTVMLNSQTDTTLPSGSTFNSLRLNDGLVGYWSLDEAGGSTSADSSGYGHTGSWTLSPTPSTDVPNVSFPDSHSLSFNGTSQYVDMGNPAYLNSLWGNALSLSAWIKPSTLSNGRVIIGKSYSTLQFSPYYAWNIFQSANAVCFRIASANVCSSAGVLTLNAWQLVTAVYDGTNMDIYVNGVSVGHTTTSGVVPSSSRAVRIGGRDTPGSGLDEFFAGNIDDVRVYRRALSSTEIAALAAGAGSGLSAATWTLGGATSISGDLSLVSGTLDTSNGNNYALSVAGNWTTVSGAFTPRSGTVTFNGTSTGKTITPNGQAFNNLTVNGSGGGWTMNGATSVNGTVTITAGTLSGPSGATVTVAGDFSNSATFTANGSTVVMTGSSKQITGSAATTFAGLQVSGTTALSATAGDAVITGLLTVDNAKQLTINSGRLVTLSGNSGTTLNLNSTGTVTGSGTLVYQNSAGATFPTTGTVSCPVRYDAVNGPQTVSARNSPNYGSSVVLYNGTASSRTFTFGSGTVSIAGSFDVQSAQTGGAVIVDVVTNHPAVTITGNVTASVGTDSITLSMGSGIWSVGGNFSATNIAVLNHNSGTLSFTGTGTFTPNGKTFYNIVTSGSAATTLLAGTTYTIAGSLTLGATTTLNQSTSTIEMVGDGTSLDSQGKPLYNLTIDGNPVTLQNSQLFVQNVLTVNTGKRLATNGQFVSLQKTTTGTTLVLNGTIDGSGTVYYQNHNTSFPTTGTISSTVQFASSSGTTLITSRTYGGNVECVAGSGFACVLDSSATVPFVINGDFVLNDLNDTVSVTGATNAPNIHVTGSVYETGGGSAVLSMGAGTWTVGGNVNLTNVTSFQHNTGTVLMNGSGSVTTAGKTLYNLTAAGGTVTLSDATTLAGALLISSGTLVAPGSTTLTVAGDFRNNGTFTHNSGTVVFNGTSQNLYGSSSTTFNNLTVSSAVLVTNTNGSDETVNGALQIDSGKSLAIESSRTVTQKGAVTLNGSITGAGRWTFTSTASWAVSSGTLSAIVRYDATGGTLANTQAIAKTYGGDLEFYSNVSSARTITLPSGSFTIGGNLKFITGSSQSFSLSITAAANPTFDVTGSITFTKGGTGIPTLTTGGSQWAVTGDVNLNNGAVSFTNGNTFLMRGTSSLYGNGQQFKNLTINGVNTTVTVAGSASVVGTLTIGGNGDSDNDTLSINTGISLTSGTSGTITIYGSGTDTITGTGTLVVDNSNLSANGVISTNVTFYSSDSHSIYATARTFSDATKTVSLSSICFVSPCTLYTGAGTLSVAGSLIFDNIGDSSTTIDLATASTALSVGGDVSVGGSSPGSITLTLGPTWTSSGNVNFTNVGTVTPGSNVLTMNGTAKTLTTVGQTMYGVTIAGSISIADYTLIGSTLTINNGASLTAPSGTELKVVNNFVNNGTYNANNGTFTMNSNSKTISGSSPTTFNNLSITGGTITLLSGGSDVTVTGTLNVASSMALAIGSGRTVTLSPTGTLSLNGTISGASATDGTFVYQPSAAFPTTGSISAPLRMDATSNNQTLGARTYSGQVELYNNSATDRVLTVGTGTSQSLTVSSNVYMKANNDGDLKIDAGTYNPSVTVAGDLKTNGTGNGTELFAMGDGTWTVTGNADLSGAYFAPHYTELNPVWDNAGFAQTFYQYDLFQQRCVNLGVTKWCLTDTDPYTYAGGDLQSLGGQTCTEEGTTDTQYAAYLKYSLAGIPSNKTIMRTDQQIYAAASDAGGSVTAIGHALSDTPDTTACGSLYDLAPAGYYNSFDSLGSTGKKWVTMIGAAADIQSRLGGTYALVMKNNTSGNGMTTFYSTDNGSSRPILRVGYADPATQPTFIMNGTGTTLKAPGTFYNLTLSGSVTMDPISPTYIYGTLDMSGTVTNNTFPLGMLGSSATIKGGGNTIGNLSIITGHTTLTGSDLSLSANLIVYSGATLTIDTGRTLTDAATMLTSVVGTVDSIGSGLLTFTPASTGPGTTGTISAPVRFDATGGAITNAIFDPRTYGGAVELYNSGSSARTVSTAVGTYLLSSSLTSTNTSSGTLTFEMNTTKPTSFTVTGTTTVGSGTAIAAPASGTFALKGNYTNNGTFTHNSGTVTLSGTSQQILSGTLTGSSGKFNNLTITNTSGTDPDSSPSVIFSTGVETAGAFTAVTPNTKLRFAAGSTNTLNALSLAGSGSGLIFIRSASYGTVANFVVGSTRSVTYTSVRDNDACGSTPNTIDASDGTSVDAGNNHCWLIETMSASINPSSVDLGTLQASSISRSGVNVTVTTNAASGYQALVAYDHALQTGSGFTIPDASGTITAGSAAFGASTSKSSQSIAQSSVSCASSGVSSNASGLSTSLQQFASAAGHVTGDSTTLCVQATPSALTPAGVYGSTLTITVTGRF